MDSCGGVDSGPLVCCIYHKPRRFDESSEEESSGSDSDSDCQNSSCPRQRRTRHPEGDGHSDGRATRDAPNKGVIHEVEEAGSSGNAYERAPKTKRN